MNETQVQTLVDLGCDREKSIMALRVTKNNVELAAELLLSVRLFLPSRRDSSTLSCNSEPSKQKVATMEAKAALKAKMKAKAVMKARTLSEVDMGSDPSAHGRVSVSVPVLVPVLVLVRVLVLVSVWVPARELPLNGEECLQDYLKGPVDLR